MKDAIDWIIGAASNAADRLRTFKGEATYYYDKTYGASLGYFRTAGDTVDIRYNTGEPVIGSIAGSPRLSASLDVGL